MIGQALDVCVLCAADICRLLFMHIMTNELVLNSLYNATLTPKKVVYPLFTDQKGRDVNGLPRY